MNKKRIYLLLLAAVSLALAATVFIIAFSISSRREAREQLGAEITALLQHADELADENKEIEGRIEELDTELSTKNTVNNYYMEYKKTHDDLTDEVERLRKQSEELDGQIEKKQGEADASALSDTTRGRSYPLSKDKASYSCPEDIPAARYKATGNGTFTVMTATGKVRLSQNLDTAYEHSYTFNLEEKERIRVTGEVTLTEIK